MNKQLTEKQRKARGRKAGIIAFGAAALLYALIFPLYRLSDFLLCAGISLVVGKVVSIMGMGLDTSRKAPSSSKEKAAMEDLPLSGDDAADTAIARGREMLQQIREANDAIPDAKLSAQMEQLENLCVQIFKTVAEKPGKAPQIRKFMNYYLPTTLKMLDSYRTMSERGVSQGDLANAHDSLTRGLDMVLTACQKQLDNLYRDTMLDVSTDIDVLEQMLKRDGFTELGMEHNPIEDDRTAAASQLRSDVPVLNVPDAAEHTGDYSRYTNNAKSTK